ncbi:ATP-binding protein [Solirubrobacter taibaiensis]|nr:ATP-binding protein [Solirubrobacter taibaiensis]
MPQPLLDLDLPATPESATVARKAVAEALREVPVDRDAVVVMVSEAVANCAAHAYPEREGRVRVHVESTGDALDVVVSDDGVGIGTAAESSGLGIGVLLMDDLADDVEVDATAGTRISARFELFGAAGPHGRQVPRSRFKGRARRKLSRLLRPRR